MSEYGCSDSLWTLFEKKARLVMNQGQSDGANRTEKWIGKENLCPSRRAAQSRINAIKVRLFWD